MSRGEALIKAIDAYLAKADDDLTETLDEAGFLKPKDTVKEIAALEDKLAEALEKETKYFKSKAKKAVDLEEFTKEWPDLIEGDDVDERLTKLFLEDFETNIPGLAAGYVKQIDPKLTVKTITARTTAWAADWSKELGELMKLESHA